MISGVIESNGFGCKFVIVLLQRVNVVSILSIPELDFFVIWTSYDDVFFLNEVNEFDDFVVGLNLPIDFEFEFLEVFV